MAVAMIVYQICEAISYIHSQNIIHLDLKVKFRKFFFLIIKKVIFLKSNFFLARKHNVCNANRKSN